LSIGELYDGHDALGLAALVRAGEVAPDELLDEALRRIDERNPVVNAVWTVFEARARRQIAGGLGHSPLSGVPLLLKDLGVQLEGEVTTQGSRFFADDTADVTSTIVERYLAAGLVVFGKTATPEFGLNCSTEPVLHGPTRNPWDTSRSAGGSSGGAGAAVAAGIVPVAHATDGGGSIRIPASCNGLFGLKPSRGRIPAGPPLGETWNGLSTSHAITRTVRDSAALLDVAAGASIGDPYASPPLPPGGFLAAMHDDPGRLRVAFATQARPGSDVDRECIVAAERAATLLAQHGHDVREVPLPIDWSTFLPAFGTVTGMHIAAAIAARAQQLGRDPGPDDLEAVVLARVVEGRSRLAIDYIAAIQTLHRFGRHIGAFFETVDLVVTPTLGSVPLPLGELDANSADLATFGARAGQVSQFLGWVNATGLPAMSVPLHWTPEGLPVGAHVVARFGSEATLFAIARQLEEAAPWWSTRAPIAGSSR